MTRGVGSLLALLLTSCTSVPNVTFDPDAATAADTAAEQLEAADAADGTTAEDATSSDSTNEAMTQQDVAIESGNDAGCPSAPPAGASVCCGTVACRGGASACQSECTNCENDCQGQTCCLDKHGNYQGCAASPAHCP